MNLSHLSSIGRRGRVGVALVGILALAGGGALIAAPSNPATAMAFHSVPSTRILDTRSGGSGTPLGANSTLDVVVPGLPDDATSVSVNVTVVLGSEASFLSVYPTGDPVPETSTVNWSDAGAVANAANVIVHADHSLQAFNSKGTVHVIIDLLGFYAPVSGGATGPQGTSAYVYASNTLQNQIPDTGVVLFDDVRPIVPTGAFTYNLDGTFTVTNAGSYKITFGVYSLLEAQIDILVDGNPGGLTYGSMVGPNTGTVVIPLTAGQTISLGNLSSGDGDDDVVLDNFIGGQGPVINAWILIERMSA